MARLNPTDLYDIRSLLAEEEQLIRDTVARWVDGRALPLMAEAFDEGRFPEELVPEMAEMGLLGSTI
ncbi:MAG: acyl-CoA dehydrogenase family protein, partial [Lysobacterales bacterium]